MEGGKGLLWVGIQGKVCAKESFLYVKRRFLRTVKSCSNERFFGCENERLLRAVRTLSVNGKLLVCGKGKLFQLMQNHLIKKKLFSAHNDTDFPPHQN